MSATASTATTAASTSAYNTPAFWEKLWRMSGINFAGLSIVTYFIYGIQPNVGASADALTAFYAGDRTRVILGAALFSMNILNLMWFAAALRTTLADAGQEGWGAAATASSAAVGSLFFVLATVSAALAYSIAGAGNASLLSGLNALLWAGVVLTSFPRAMLVMAGSFGLWRARIISNTMFSAGVAVVILVLLGGFTWMSDGLLAPDGAYSRYVSPAINLAWIAVASQVLLKRTPARAGW